MYIELRRRRETLEPPRLAGRERCRDEALRSGNRIERLVQIFTLNISAPEFERIYYISNYLLILQGVGHLFCGADVAFF
jgi:hypothetical protein